MAANAPSRRLPPVREALQGLHFFTRFAFSFSALGYRQRQLLWSSKQASFKAQRWLVTGASRGIGKAIAVGAAARGAHVLGVARDAAKLSSLAGEQSNVDTIAADLSLAGQIEAMVEQLEIDSAGKTIDVLVNNVGVLLNEWQLTSEGNEASFATNLLGHFALTTALIERGLLSEDALVINMTSGGMYNVPLSITNLNMLDASAHDGVMAYAYQKRAQVELNRWWRRQHAGSGLQFYVMHPGWVDTEGVKTSLPAFRALFACVLRDAQAGADTALWLAAERPRQIQGDAVWFDRKARAAHIGSATRRSDDDGDELAVFLRETLTTTRNEANR